MYVCVCNAVSDREIREAVSLGVRTFEELRETLAVATVCKQCTECARDVLEQALQRTPACAAAEG